MNSKIILGLLFLFIALMVINCSKEEEEVPPAEDLVFNSLISEKDTILSGEQTKITANATGSRLEYFWSAFLGDIVGSGAEVTYVASPCQAGKNEITCRITNGSTQSETKSIYIVVL